MVATTLVKEARWCGRGGGWDYGGGWDSGWLAMLGAV